MLPCSSLGEETSSKSPSRDGLVEVAGEENKEEREEEKGEERDATTHNSAASRMVVVVDVTPPFVLLLRPSVPLRLRVVVVCACMIVCGLRDRLCTALLDPEEFPLLARRGDALAVGWRAMLPVNNSQCGWFPLVTLFANASLHQTPA